MRGMVGRGGDPNRVDPPRVTDRAWLAAGARIAVPRLDFSCAHEPPVMGRQLVRGSFAAEPGAVDRSRE